MKPQEPERRFWKASLEGAHAEFIDIGEEEQPSQRSLAHIEWSRCLVLARWVEFIKDLMISWIARLQLK